MPKYIKLLILLLLPSLDSRANSTCLTQFSGHVPVSEAIEAANQGDKLRIETEFLRLTPSNDATLSTAWSKSIEGFSLLNNYFGNSESTLSDLAAVAMARQFAWLNGRPGGAKTAIARALFKAELRSLSHEEKKIFMIQFHRLLSEGLLLVTPSLPRC